MRIFYAFVIVIASAILFVLPVSEGIYDFRTEFRTDTYSTDTAVGVTTANETLLGDLYNCDLGSVSIDSTLATDTPLAGSINCTNRVLNITGLTANTTRTLDITYDYDALQGNTAVNSLMDNLPWIWILIIVGFGPAAILAIFMGKV
jgi:hypothetical protein